MVFLFFGWLLFLFYGLEASSSATPVFSHRLPWKKLFQRKARWLSFERVEWSTGPRRNPLLVFLRGYFLVRSPEEKDNLILKSLIHFCLWKSHQKRGIAIHVQIKRQRLSVYPVGLSCVLCSIVSGVCDLLSKGSFDPIFQCNFVRVGHIFHSPWTDLKRVVIPDPHPHRNLHRKLRRREEWEDPRSSGTRCWEKIIRKKARRKNFQNQKGEGWWHSLFCMKNRKA